MSGFVQVNRSLWENPDFDGPEMSKREAFIWMIAHAAWKPTRARAGKTVVNLERGQLAYSVRFLAEKFGWSKSRVHRFLDALKNRDTIGTASGTGVLVISICNYEKYQLGSKVNGTDTERKPGQKRDKEEDRIIPEEDTNVSTADSAEVISLVPEQPCEIDLAVKHYNQTAHRLMAENDGDKVWPIVRVPISPKRKKHVLARLKAHGLRGFCDMIDRAAIGDHLIGLSKSVWFADFDWLIKDENFTKVTEGKYDPRINHRARHVSAGTNHGYPASGESGQGTLAAELVRRASQRQDSFV